MDSATPFPTRAVVGLGLGLLAGFGAWNLLPHDPLASLPTMKVDVWTGDPKLTMPKPADEFRILAVGLSPTGGFPYAPAGAASFASWVEHGLGGMTDGKKVVCRPYAMTGADAPAVVRLVEQALKFDPDLLCVEFGANDLGVRVFREKELVPDGSHGRITDRVTRSRLLLEMFASEQERPDEEAGADGSRPEELIAGKIQGFFGAKPGEPHFAGLPVGERDREAMGERLRDAVRDIVGMAESAGVELWLWTSPYDLRGNWPRGLLEPDDVVDCAVAMWRRDGRLSDELLAQVAESPRGDRADVVCLLGHLAWADGRREFGLELLREARDRDVAPVHTIGLFESIVAEEVQTSSALGMQEVVRAIEARPELFVDVSHPSVDGQQEMAVEFVRLLSSRGKVKLPADWEPRLRAANRAAAAEQFSEKARRIARARTARTTILLHQLLGNPRDAVPWFGIGIVGLRDEVAGPTDNDWLQWAAIAAFTAAGLAGNADQLTEGDADTRARRLLEVAAELWALDVAGVDEWMQRRSASRDR